MGLTVFKQTFNLADIVGDKVKLTLPAWAEILTVAEQFKDSGTLQVWYRCNPDAGKVDRHLHVVGTGGPAPQKVTSKYLSTVILMDSALVLHFFNDGEKA